MIDIGLSSSHSLLQSSSIISDIHVHVYMYIVYVNMCLHGVVLFWKLCYIYVVRVCIIYMYMYICTFSNYDMWFCSNVQVLCLISIPNHWID